MVATKKAPAKKTLAKPAVKSAAPTAVKKAAAKKSAQVATKTKLSGPMQEAIKNAAKSLGDTPGLSAKVARNPQPAGKGGKKPTPVLTKGVVTSKGKKQLEAKPAKTTDKIPGTTENWENGKLGNDPKHVKRAPKKLQEQVEASLGKKPAAKKKPYKASIKVPRPIPDGPKAKAPKKRENANLSGQVALPINMDLPVPSTNASAKNILKHPIFVNEANRCGRAVVDVVSAYLKVGKLDFRILTLDDCAALGIEVKMVPNTVAEGTPKRRSDKEVMNWCRSLAPFPDQVNLALSTLHSTRPAPVCTDALENNEVNRGVLLKSLGHAIEYARRMGLSITGLASVEDVNLMPLETATQHDA